MVLDVDVGVDVVTGVGVDAGGRIFMSERPRTERSRQ